MSKQTRSERARTYISLMGVIAAIVAVGCDGGSGEMDAGSMMGTDAGSVMDTDAGTVMDTDAGSMMDTDAGTVMDTDAGTMMHTDAGLPGVTWALRGHDCPGTNRTDALHVDADGSIWIGCGSGATGDGLYVSRDDGATWEIPATSPSGILGGFRVLSIHRGADDLIYVAGQGPASTMAISLDTSSSPYAAEAVLTRVSRVGLSFLTSPFVTTSSGAAFADSFVGHDALYRADATVSDPADEWVNARDWEESGPSHQIQDMVAVGERFVAVGSTISEAPFVFMPTIGATDPWQMTPIEMVSGLGAWTGELQGVAATETRVIAVGVDQRNHMGKIFVSGADLYDASDYTEFDIDPLLPGRLSAGNSTWARGVCMAGDRIVVVGEIQPLGAGGFVLESLDAGATFSDITPDSSPATWSKCQIGAGRLVLAGAGMIGILPD